MKIFVINAGSSSLKYQLFDMDNEEVLAAGLCERIGIDGHMKHKPLVGGKPVFDEDIDLPDHSKAIAAVLDIVAGEKYGVITDISEIGAVGHRVVHGGEHFNESVLITDEVMKALDDCIPLAPLHNPANISGIKACQAVMPGIAQVAVFDTAFHQTMPAKAFTYAIPYRYYEEDKIRRYGFHGTSHRYVADRAADMLGKPASDLKIISCHMGNGSSICAVDGGKSVDTSMGFTPLAGMPMGTRCGTIDSGILQFIMNKEGIDIDKMLNILNKESGVLGVSGVSSDFRDLDNASKDNKRAKLALDMFNYEVAKIIGSYAIGMKGADAIVFTAGIGENSANVRESICEYLGILGCELDLEANKTRGEELVVSTPNSKVKILVIPTNEELVIARDTKSIVG